MPFVAIATGIYRALSKLNTTSVYKTLSYIFITSSKEPLLRDGSRSTASCGYFGNLCRNWGSLEEGKSTQSSCSFMDTLMPLFIAITINWNDSRSSPPSFPRGSLCQTRKDYVMMLETPQKTTGNFS